MPIRTRQRRMEEERATGKSRPSGSMSVLTKFHHRGRPGDEIEDHTNYTLANPRRRSNSSSQAKGVKDFKTKFEEIEPEPVFEAPEMGSEEPALEHQSTTSSDNSNDSVEEET